jgi:hypothetical protein
MRDVIIGCSTNYKWDTIKYWINSINKTGFGGDKVMVLMNCDRDTAKKVAEAGFSIIAFGEDEQGNLTYNPLNFLCMWNDSYIFTNTYAEKITGMS